MGCRALGMRSSCLISFAENQPYFSGGARVRVLFR